MHFAEVRHSLFSNNTIHFIASSYDIGKILNCSFLTRGLNDTYLVVTDKKKYIFRVYRKDWRKKSDILFELDAINYASCYGVSVSIPLKRRDGHWLSEIPAPEGTRYGVLFSFTKGDRPEINEENCNIIGKALGNLHNAMDAFTSQNPRSFELDLTHLLDEPADLIIPTLKNHCSDNEDTFKRIINDLRIHLQKNDNLEFGFCHGDFHNFNMHVYDQKLEVFDFDCSGFGFRAYDISVFLWNLKQNYSNLESSCWDAFMNGYLSSKNISDHNIREIAKFVTIRRIWFMGILLKNDDVWGTIWRNKSNFDTFISQLEQDAEKY
ncbi:phosphotransferase [Bacillus sp. B-jedd]|uniref:phosphotransferase n=1 Tax=Bacillus sp. B-jedd TaxID=1476857 RepID=UPI0005156A8D|nr:phosphotransferase [Bacillus sp. B-jedd]CEG27356.1 homoserine kinase type II (protein kinase fold) [Bacillus sp. B-jedd]